MFLYICWKSVDFFLLTVTQNAFTSHVHLTLDTLSQGDQQTNLLLII